MSLTHSFFHSLIVRYIFLNYLLTINQSKSMAHLHSIDGIKMMTGAISKIKDGPRLSVTRVKCFKDPITGEVVAMGPNELYLQERRDLSKNPLSQAEQAQRAKWREACKAAQLILRDKSHPRYMELYHRWRAQLNAKHSCKQFPNFVRSVLVNET